MCLALFLIKIMIIINFLSKDYQINEKYLLWSFYKILNKIFIIYSTYTENSKHKICKYGGRKYQK